MQSNSENAELAKLSIRENCILLKSNLKYRVFRFITSPAHDQNLRVEYLKEFLWSFKNCNLVTFYLNVAFLQQTESFAVSKTHPSMKAGLHRASMN